MATNTSARDLLTELGLSDDTQNISSSSSSEGEIVSDEIMHIKKTNGEDIDELKKLLKQTQSELRNAQKNLLRSESGKENRLKILRKTHQSALSLKQSLIQELLDIIAGKDEYICQLESRLTGKTYGHENLKETALAKLVSKFTQLSKDYVDLQSQYEQTKEELSQEHANSCSDHQISQSSLSHSKLMLTEIKELQFKLEVFDKERQNHLKMKEENVKLQNQIEELKGKLTIGNKLLALKESAVNELLAQVSSLEEQLQSTSLEFKKLQQENAVLSRERTKVQDQHEKCLIATKVLADTFDSKNSESMKLDIFQPNLLLIRRTLQDCVHDLKDIIQSVKQMSVFAAEDFSITAQKIYEKMFRLCEKNVTVRRKYLLEMKQRKKLHNQLVELKGNIRVFCRVRPVIEEDGSDMESAVVVTVDPDDDSIVCVENKNGIKVFEMDKVFGSGSSQCEIFDEVQPLITSCTDGYNVCIIAYGQTGSGKTFTMEGPLHDPGINQRALNELFLKIKLANSEWKYSVFVSMMEIYNDCTYDLLSSNKKLDIKLNTDGLYIPELTQVSVSSIDEVNTVFSLGHNNRSTAATKMNISSSRSHAILCVSVMGHNVLNGTKTFGKLNLVDLAGSERVHKSGSDGIRLLEAKHINKSLSSLADVIHNLKIKSRHIPYRNSKLTYLLQDSLGGESKTLMVVQLSPVQKNTSETLCSLNFAQRVRAVELGPAKKIVK